MARPIFTTIPPYSGQVFYGNDGLDSLDTTRALLPAYGSLATHAEYDADCRCLVYDHTGSTEFGSFRPRLFHREPCGFGGRRVRTIIAVSGCAEPI